MRGAGPQRPREPDQRRDAGFSWLAPPDGAPRRGPALPAERALPPVAGRALDAGRPRQAGPERHALSRFEPARPGLAQPSEAESADPAAVVRPEIAANLSLADLHRVRQALVQLSDEPAVPSEQTSAPGLGPVSASVTATAPSQPGSDDDEEGDTTPLPVILPGATAVPRPDLQESARGPFEPARLAPADAAALAPAGSAAAVSAATAAPVSADTVPAPADTAQPAAPESAEKLPAAAAEKLDEIKDLLITAEAIGEVNLDRHFDRVSQRQRELIREFFERAIPGDEPDA